MYGPRGTPVTPRARSAAIRRAPSGSRGGDGRCSRLSWHELQRLALAPRRAPAAALGVEPHELPVRRAQRGDEPLVERGEQLERDSRASLEQSLARGALDLGEHGVAADRAARR